MISLFFNIFFLVSVLIMSYIAIKTAKNDVLKSKLKNTRILFLASASSTNKKRREAMVFIPEGQKFIVNGQAIDETQYQQLLVDGWSMKRFGVENGDVVFVNFANRTKSDLLNNPIIALKIDPKKKNKIEYKLRKFVDIQSFKNIEDFQKWIADNRSDLEGRYEICKVENRIREAQEQSCKLVISETMVKRFGRKRVPHCSVHLENDIFGKVQYRVPREKVQVLNKQ